MSRCFVCFRGMSRLCASGLREVLELSVDSKPALCLASSCNSIRAVYNPKPQLQRMAFTLFSSFPQLQCVFFSCCSGSTVALFISNSFDLPYGSVLARRRAVGPEFVAD